MDDPSPATISSIGTLVALAQATDSADLLEKATEALRKYDQQAMDADDWKAAVSTDEPLRALVKSEEEEKKPVISQESATPRERVHKPPFKVPSPALKAKPSGSGWVRSNSSGGAANFRPNSRGRSGERPKRE